MIILNGKKFAKNNSEFTDSLFQPGGTCVGYYKVNKRSITIQDHNHNKVGVISCHRVMAKATKQDNGKFWYSCGDIDIIGRYDSFTQECEEVRTALDSCGVIQP